jgi:hypothetical protein
MKRPNTLRGKQPRKLAIANRGKPEKALLNRERAFQLRTEGKTYRQIAMELGVSVEVAYRYVDDFWCETHGRVVEKAVMLRAMELEVLDALTARWQTIALKGECLETALKATCQLLKIQERRAKLLGLDAVVKVKGAVAHMHLTYEEFQKRYEEAKASA